MRRILINGALAAGSVLATILMIEGALWANFFLEHRTISDSADELRAPPNYIEDSALRLRIAPGSSGHDERGFRNAEALSVVDLVAMGDSQTYGTNVAASDAWPQQLSRLANIDVYNMGMPWSGPAHFYSLTRSDLPELETQVLVVAIYMGNDLVDAYDMVYEYEYGVYSEFRDAGLRQSVDAGGTTTDPTDIWQDQFNSQQEYVERFRLERRKALSALERFFQDKTRSYWWLANRGIFNPRAQGAAEDAYRQWALDHSEDATLVEVDGLETILTPRVRGAAVDLSNPTVSEGLRLTAVFLSLIENELTRNGIELLVVVIPTKELVYAKTVEEEGFADPVLDRLVEDELLASDYILGFCSDEGLSCIHVLEALRTGLARGERIYPTHVDGHPTPQGHALIAGSVLEYLIEEDWISKVSASAHFRRICCHADNDWKSANVSFSRN